MQGEEYRYSRDFELDSMILEAGGLRHVWKRGHLQWFGIHSESRPATGFRWTHHF